MQVKEFMLPGQHKLGKHRPAKPFGKDESASLFRGKRCLLFLISPKKGKNGAPEETGVMLASEKIKGKIQVIRDG